jgi:ADP-ribose pyrophosphatase
MSFRVLAKGRLGALLEYDVVGAPYPHEVLVRPPGVRVMAIDNRSGGLWMTKEFRSELHAFDLRLPGGKVFDDLETFLPLFLKGDDVADEDILSAAKREFREEVGLSLVEERLLSRSPAGSIVQWDLYYVLGMSDGQDIDQKLEFGEDIQPVLVPTSQLEELVRGGDIREERSAIAVLRALHAGQLSI